MRFSSSLSRYSLTVQCRRFFLWFRAWLVRYWFALTINEALDLICHLLKLEFGILHSNLAYLQPEEVPVLERIKPENNEVSLCKDLNMRIVLEHHQIDFLVVRVKIDPTQVGFALLLFHSQNPITLVWCHSLGLRVVVHLASTELQRLPLDLHDINYVIRTAASSYHQPSLVLLR